MASTWLGQRAFPVSMSMILAQVLGIGTPQPPRMAPSAGWKWLTGEDSVIPKPVENHTFCRIFRPQLSDGIFIEDWQHFLFLFGETRFVMTRIRTRDIRKTELKY